MKYKLNERSSHIEFTDLDYTDKILYNHGIRFPNEYRNLNSEYVHPYELLKNITEAANTLALALKKDYNIGILCDPDVDGICSSSMVFQYIKKLFPESHIEYFIHSKKQHGLSNDINIPDNLAVLIVPDAGSNDVEQCKKLQEAGLTIIILDHHEIEVENPYCYLVNPFNCDYPNKAASGALISYKFLQALDDVLWENEADNYLDLVAFGLIGDSMDLSEYENKFLVDYGLKHIKNKMLQAFIDKQEYSINGIVNIQNIQYYISPLCNGLIRSGGYEEKDMMFRAFCQIYEEFDYEKRGSGLVKEGIYDRVARLCVNAKAKQNREIDKYLEQIVPNIEKHEWNLNKILFCNAEELDGNYTGLVATKLANMYNRPCFLMRPTKDDNNILAGSARNIDNSPIYDLKKFVLDTGLFEMAQGHANAHGISIKKKNLKEAIDFVNESLKDWDFEKFWTVDFILESNDITESFLSQCLEAKFHSFEAIVLIKNIVIHSSNIQLIGKEKNTMKFEFEDSTGEVIAEAIKFKLDKDDPIFEVLEDWGGKIVRIDAIVKIGENVYNGLTTKQLMILDYEIK
jgi:single-stranded-DNA-specific exonuclease